MPVLGCTDRYIEDGRVPTLMRFLICIMLCSKVYALILGYGASPFQKSVYGVILNLHTINPIAVGIQRQSRLTAMIEVNEQLSNYQDLFYSSLTTLWQKIALARSFRSNPSLHCQCWLAVMIDGESLFYHHYRLHATVIT